MRVTKHSFCDNKATIISIGNVDIYFSYDTAIALRAPGLSCHRPNDWGPTTAKHMREMGTSNYGEEVDEEGLTKNIALALANLSKECDE